MTTITRRFRVTAYQMLRFREQLSDDKRIHLHGTAERGHITVALPFRLGEVLLTYQHITEDGLAQLEIALIAHPEAISPDTVWQSIAQKIEEAQEHCPQGA